jgi:hypothetical protein
VLLVAVGAAQTGCSLIYRQYVSLGWDYLLEDPDDRRSDRDRFVEWRGKKKPGFPGAPFGIAVAPVYLRAPFTLDQTVGIFDPDDRAGSANTSGCVELDEEGFFGSPGHFFFLCLDYLLTPVPGVSVRTSVSSSTMFYPGVYGGDVRIRADTLLTLQFRPLGSTSFDTIASAPIVDPAIQWYPSIGALGLYKGGVMDFGETRWTNTPPPKPTSSEKLAWDIEEVVRFLNEACIDLDGFDPDLAQAGENLQASFSFVVEARSDLALLTDPSLARKIGKKLDCLDKNAGKALDQVADGNVERAIGKIGKSLRCAGDALVRLRDFQVDF